MTTLGPWYVNDTPVTPIEVAVTRDGIPADLSVFASASAFLVAPDGRIVVAWAGSVSIGTSTLTLEPPSSTPFTRQGLYQLYATLTTPGGARETFPVAYVQIVSTARTWPPTLAELKTDNSIKPGDTASDAALQQVLDAAIVFYERVKAGTYDFTNDPTTDLPHPDADVHLGIVRLAYRWHVRRRSPAMLMALGDLGETRLPSFDPDIERLLQIGRRRGFTFA